MDMRVMDENGLGGSRGVLAAAEAWREEETDFALVLVVDTEGSTYRKPGAFLVARDDGIRRGVLSGGCLEPSIDDLAREALDADCARFAEFDTREDDDLLFGSGSGCRGLMRVVAIPIRPDRSEPLYEAIVEAMEAGHVLRVAMATDGKHAGSGAGCFATQELVFGSASCGIPEDWRSGTPGAREVSGRTFAVFDIRPPLRLIVFGAGSEALPLLRCARTLGWYVAIADHREALFAPGRLEADRMLCARPAAACEELDPLRFDAGIAMTHQASTDLGALRAMAVRSIPYVGLLGPSLRREELIAQLTPEEEAALNGRLHAPVGMALGGEGPEAIALSIVADLQRHSAGLS